jgi:hypothetical protein
MQLIPLTQGLFTKVDDWNYDRLMEHKWYANRVASVFYAKRTEDINGKPVTIYMHREILGTPKGTGIDHKDHDGLNNLEENIRECNQSQNNMNKRPYGKSKYLGVYFDRQYIIAAIRLKGKKIHIGVFKTEEEAARAYDKKAKELFGEFANPNFK